MQERPWLQQWQSQGRALLSSVWQRVGEPMQERLASLSGRGAPGADTREPEDGARLHIAQIEGVADVGAPVPDASVRLRAVQAAPRRRMLLPDAAGPSSAGAGADADAGAHADLEEAVAMYAAAARDCAGAAVATGASEGSRGGIEEPLLPDEQSSASEDGSE